VTMSPRPGANRGKVVVTDRRSGSTQVLRIDVFVRAPAADPLRRDSHAGTSQVGFESSATDNSERTAQDLPISVPAASSTEPRDYWHPPTAVSAPPPPNPPPVSTRAVVALVLAIVWLYGLGSVMALILASRAAKEIDSGRAGRGIVRAARIIAVVGIVLTVFAIIGAASAPR
jgi:hypothetical protein